MMNFQCTMPPNISEAELIVLPISMNQPLEQGAMLASILRAFDDQGYKNNVTILICDYLHRHNCTNESDALLLGEKFIEEHASLLQGYKIIRWKEFLDGIDENKFRTYLNILREKSPQGSRFYNKMKKTWEKCLSADQTLEHSIAYQLEEFAAILCMNDYKHLFYPKRITNGMAYLYSQIEGYKPTYHHIKISEVKSNNLSSEIKDEVFFIGTVNPSQNRNHIHIAFRGLLEHMELLLGSQELSPKSKHVFAEEAENILMKHGYFPESSS